MRSASRIVILFYDFPLPALCALGTVVGVPVALWSVLRERELEECQLLCLLVDFGIDPEITHIGIFAQAAVVDDIVRVVRKLQLRPSVVIKGLPSLTLNNGLGAFLCDIP